MLLAAGYFDESTDDDRFYTVAGFVAYQDAAVVLEMRWHDLLRHYGLEYFKASELNAGEGQFKQFRDDPKAKGWKPFSQREKDKFTEIKSTFTDAIVGCQGLHGIGAALILPDYERIKHEYSPARAKIAAPYFECASLMMIEAGHMMIEDNEDIKALGYRDSAFLRPIFDSHEDYSRKVKQTFDGFCKQNPKSAKYLLPPHYESDKDYLMLQAADNLAFETGKLLVREHFEPFRQERISTTRLKEAGSILRIYKLDYSSLKLLADAVDSDTLPFDPTIEVPLDELSKGDAIES